MKDNYYKIIDLIENFPNKTDINSRELNDLVKQTSIYNKTEIILYCNVKIRNIKKQLFKNDCLSLGLGLLLAIIIYIFFNMVFVNLFWTIMIILDCIILVFCLRPGGYLLINKYSKYKNFKSKFSSN